LVEALIVLLGAFVAALYVCVPLFDDERARDDGSEAVADREARKNEALLSILDLDAEREADKVSAEDYEGIRLEYERTALAAMRELDVLREVHSNDGALETEIDMVRSQLSCPTCDRIQTEDGRCTACGA
jgi:hypothetical protein